MYFNTQKDFFHVKTTALALVLVSGYVQAASFTEKQVYEYRQTMYQAGQDLKNNQATSAFAKILPMAQQGFPEAQYIIGTLYHDGEGVAQNLAQAKHLVHASRTTNNQQRSRSIGTTRIKRFEISKPHQFSGS